MVTSLGDIWARKVSGSGEECTLSQQAIRGPDTVIFPIDAQVWTSRDESLRKCDNTSSREVLMVRKWC
jgi:hypothetical protein